MKQHQREILDPIANQIILQLNVRPPVGRWPDTSEKRQIAKIISQAICAKKGLTHPRALHPEDPFPFLFWGTDDDLTPALVRIELGKQFHFDLPSDVILRAWNERWTLQTFINCCDHHRQSHAEG